MILLSLGPHTDLQNGFLGIGTIIMAISSLSSFWRSMQIHKHSENQDLDADAMEALNEEVTNAQLSSFVSAMASVQFLVLWAGYGRMELSNGEEFVWITYVEWAITTPFMLLSMANLAHSMTSVKLQLTSLCLSMIITGAIGAAITHVGWRYLFFCISSVFFIGAMLILWQEQVRIYTNLQDSFRPVATLFRRLTMLTIISWSFYPLLFILGPNGNVMPHSGVYLEIGTILDIVSKGVWGFLISFTQRSLHKTAEQLMEDPSIGGLQGVSLLQCLVECGLVDARWMTYNSIYEKQAQMAQYPSQAGPYQQQTPNQYQQQTPNQYQHQTPNQYQHQTSNGHQSIRYARGQEPEAYFHVNSGSRQGEGQLVDSSQPRIIVTPASPLRSNSSGDIVTRPVRSNSGGDIAASTLFATYSSDRLSMRSYPSSDIGDGVCDDRREESIVQSLFMGRNDSGDRYMQVPVHAQAQPEYDHSRSSRVYTRGVDHR